MPAKRLWAQTSLTKRAVGFVVQDRRMEGGTWNLHVPSASLLSTSSQYVTET